jgi:hypothetical protein
LGVGYRAQNLSGQKMIQLLYCHPHRLYSLLRIQLPADCSILDIDGICCRADAEKKIAK